ncbi:hypothetical protein [Parapedobacter sp. ISTM3]|nr:hypothetical protein [Parapedobacter sp. ISTM3]
MKLHVFNADTRRQWAEAGYQFVKLSSSEDIGFERRGNGTFILL